MKLPKEWNDFRDNVIRRSRFLIKNGFWSIEDKRLATWLDNFQTDSHIYLAVHMLDSMIFRTDKMLINAYKLYFYSKFKNKAHLHNSNIATNLNDWANKIQNKYHLHNSKIHVCGLRKIKDAGESGGVIIRKLNSDVISEGNVIHPDRDIFRKYNNRMILIVDDFMGSGRQFGSFYDSYDLSSLVKKNKVIYVPMIAMKSTFDDIKKKYPDIEFDPIEFLDESKNFFYGDDEDNFKEDGVNTVADAKECYEDILRSYNLDYEHKYGRSDAALTLGFEWGCPSLTLPIIYKKPANGHKWQILLTRRS